MIPFWIMLILKILSDIMFIVYQKQCPWIFETNTTPTTMSFVVYFLCNAYIPCLISILFFGWISRPRFQKSFLIYFIVCFCIFIGAFVLQHFFQWAIFVNVILYLKVQVILTFIYFTNLCLNVYMYRKQIGLLQEKEMYF